MIRILPIVHDIFGFLMNFTIAFSPSYQHIFFSFAVSEFLEQKLSIAQKLNFSKRFDSEENMIVRIAELKQDWNNTFENKNYSKIKKQLQI
ncbi:hypothetical protein D0T60_16320 [Bacteroides sp. 224]|nr:hypothetical protein [Bacteroides sp. 224]